MPSVRFYPPAFRNIRLDGGAGTAEYDCEYVQTPDGYTVDEDSLYEHYHKDFYNKYYKTVTGSNPAVKKFMDKARVRDLLFLVNGSAKLTKKEIEEFSDTLLFDFIIEIAFNMLVGDGRYTPDTPQYRFMTALTAKLDSLISAQPFIDVKNKYLGGYSVTEVITPMLYNGSVPDKAGELDFTKEPPLIFSPAVPVSHAGDVLMGVLSAAGIVLAPLTGILSATALPVMTVLHKIKSKNTHSSPQMKYR